MLLLASWEKRARWGVLEKACRQCDTLLNICGGGGDDKRGAEGIVLPITLKKGSVVPHNQTKRLSGALRLIIGVKWLRINPLQVVRGG